tara:strand:- start:858 stop:1055 length:198 start_codon:yes stop_codon:yes gene_type:complete
MAISKKEQTIQVTAKFPADMLKQIDSICKETFRTRVSWMLVAAKAEIDRTVSIKAKQQKVSDDLD